MLLFSFSQSSLNDRNQLAFLSLPYAVFKLLALFRSPAFRPLPRVLVYINSYSSPRQYLFLSFFFFFVFFLTFLSFMTIFRIERSLFLL